MNSLLQQIWYCDWIYRMRTTMRKQWEGLTLPREKERSTRTTTRCSQIAHSTTPRWWEINWSPNLTRSVTYHFLSWVLLETFEFFVRTIEIESYFSYLVLPWTKMTLHHCAVRHTSCDCCLYFKFSWRCECPFNAFLLWWKLMYQYQIIVVIDNTKHIYVLDL